MVERGQMLPPDEWVSRLEETSGAAVGAWYPADVLDLLAYATAKPDRLRDS